MPLAVRPARILNPAEHRRPAIPIRAEAIRRGTARLVGVAVDLAGRGSGRRADLAVLRQPRRLDEAVAFLVRQEHVPAVGQAVLAREIDAPLRDERHLPVERHDLLRVRRADVDRVPHAGAFEHGDPDLAPLLAEVDLRPGDGTLVALAGQRHAHVLGAVLEDAHHDRVLLAREVQEEVLAGQLDLVERNFARVEENVVREEVRQDGEAAGTFDAQRRVAGERLRLDEEIALLEAEARGARLRRHFETDGRRGCSP